MERIVVTGAAGQIGTEMVSALRGRYGTESVLATDIRIPDESASVGPFALADVTIGDSLDAAVARHRADTIFHLAAILSAVGEQRPQKTYEVNIGGLFNVLEVARARDCAVFTPSSIAAFGPGTPADPTPQDTIQRPNTMYGVTKVAGELLCDYYHKRFGLDTRGVRYPGLISWRTPPGRRHDGLRGRDLLRGGARRPLHLLPGSRHAARHDVHARRDPGRDRAHGGRPREAAAPQRVQRYRHAGHPRDARRRRSASTFPTSRSTTTWIPVRQGIAESWPRRIDDSAAREEWGWRPEFDARRDDGRHAGESDQPLKGE